jgi:hypothetical protein
MAAVEDMSYQIEWQLWARSRPRRTALNVRFRDKPTRRTKTAIGLKAVFQTEDKNHRAKT